MSSANERVAASDAAVVNAKEFSAGCVISDSCVVNPRAMLIVQSDNESNMILYRRMFIENNCIGNVLFLVSK